MRVKIYYHHTDCGGVVYYANYLKFFEEARTEFFNSKGISLKELANNNTLFVVSRQEIDYKLPAFYADTLEVATRLIQVRSVRIEFGHEIINKNGKTICLARTLMVCVDKDFKPKAIPEEVVKKIT